MSTQDDLTDRYRRVLALLPRTYREQRGEEMLAVMLDTAESEGRGGPSLGELLSVLGLSLRLRTGSPGSGPRAQSVGETLRLITLIGLLLQAAVFVFAPAGLVQLTGIPSPTAYAAFLRGYGFWHGAGEMVGFICPLIAFTALLQGRRRLGLALTTNALVIPTVFTAYDGYLCMQYRHVFTLALLAIPTISGLLGFHRDAPRVPRPRRWYATMCLVIVPLLVATSTPISPDAEAASNALIIVCGAAVVCFALTRAPRSAAWPAALLITGAPLLIFAPYSLTFTDLDAALYGNPTIWVAAYALVIEILLALTLAVSLMLRLRTATTRAVG